VGTILSMLLQVRSKISTFGGFGGPTEVTCGGNALKFYSSVRLNIKRVGFVKKGEEVQFIFHCSSIASCSGISMPVQI
jgi:recombination protein RecA